MKEMERAAAYVLAYYWPDNGLVAAYDYDYEDVAYMTAYGSEAFVLLTGAFTPQCILSFYRRGVYVDL